MDITLILCTCDRPACIKRLLESLCNLQLVPTQIIVVDASRDDKTKAIVESIKGLPLEYYHSERGLTRQRNFGLDSARGEIVGFFDDDTVPDPDFFEHIRGAFIKTNAGCVVPYIYEDNELAIPGFKGWLFRMSNRVWGIKYLAAAAGCRTMPSLPFTGNVDGVIVSGAGFFCLREVFEQFKFASWMHGYSYGEDFDFGLRIRDVYRVVGCGDARMHHYHEPGGRESHFRLAEMGVYNCVRIIGSTRQSFLFFRKIDVLLRRLISIFITSSLFLLKGKCRAGLNGYLGGVYGAIRSLSLLTKSISQCRGVIGVVCCILLEVRL